jgi:hypothetical protein
MERERWNEAFARLGVICRDILRRDFDVNTNWNRTAGAAAVFEFALNAAKCVQRVEENFFQSEKTALSTSGATTTLSLRLGIT